MATVMQSIKNDLDFISDALNSFWHQANEKLSGKNLGDIERKNYENQRAKSKVIMDEIDDFFISSHEYFVKEHPEFKTNVP